MVAIRNKVTFELEIDSDNLPEPYGSVETGDDEGGLDGGLEFGERDESGRDGDDEEDEEGNDHSPCIEPVVLTAPTHEHLCISKHKPVDI